MKKKIVITGGDGRLAKHFKPYKNSFKIELAKKKELDILNVKKISKYLNKIKPKYLIHNAALSRPMDIHENKIQNSITKNIIGTCNIVNECSKRNIKLIYFSTNYVYPGVRGNYKESSALLPINNYAWSKLGGECAVQMYKNSLILRLSITEKPFIHKKAFSNIITNFMYQENAVPIILKLIDKKGVINIGGKSQSIYEFAKKDNKNIKSTKYNFKNNIKMPKNSSMNLDKMNNFINKYRS
tara:strand:+ start:23114 stop:23836 length:723 start_codon:yes stop_codon:yes gene_type:complete